MRKSGGKFADNSPGLLTFPHSHPILKDSFDSYSVIAERKCRNAMILTNEG
jgi:hypothetical protein